MMSLNLGFDEVIILQGEEIECDDFPQQYLEELILTNKKLICIFETSTGPFSSSVTEANEIDLKTIKIVNGIPQVKFVNNATLQILLKNGRQWNFIFYENPKKEIPKWIDAIKTNIIGMPEPVFLENSEAKDKGKESTELKSDEKFCAYCGERVSVDAKFCAECGSNLISDGNVCSEEVNPSSMKLKAEKKRKVKLEKESCENVDKKRKCPACGSLLPSITAVCPACGYEIKNTEVSIALKIFIENIGGYDFSIREHEGKIQRGWSTWPSEKKIGWVLLNIIFTCYPLILYLLYRHIWPLLVKPKLTAEESRKVDFIENYTFPNDREAILDALLFIKGKIAYVSSEKINQKNLYWLKVWSNKAMHLYNKAELLFPGDSVAKNVVEFINDKMDKTNKVIKRRSIIGVAVVIVLIVNVYINGIYSATLLNTEHNKTFEWPMSGISQQLPVPQTNYGEISIDNDDNFSFELYRVSPEQFEDYIKACIDKGFNLYSSKSDHSFDAYNAEEYKLHIFYSDDELSIDLEAPLSMSEIRWPNSDLVKRIPVPESLTGYIETERADYFVVYLDNVTEEKYDAYINACMDQGFTKDYSRSENSFSAYDKNGNYLVVEKEMFDKMHLKISTDK